MFATKPALNDLKNPPIAVVNDLTNGILLSSLKTPPKSVFHRPRTDLTIGATALSMLLPNTLTIVTND